jgi:glycosyltransferase involved in cell wall biosynthesis
MIVKNEETTLERCLNSVKHLVDEINIIDTGSTDNTKEIALKFTNRIYDFTWVDHFAKARNYAFEQATKQYIFWLDADDVLLKQDQKKFMKLKKQLDSSVDSVTMKYVLGVDEYGNISSSLRRNRLVKRENQFKWHGMVHEYLEVWGNIINSDIAVTHKSEKHDHNRNSTIYEKQLEKGSTFTPRDLFYFANELKDHHQYERAIQFYHKFLSTDKGWIEDNIAACGRLADCYHHLGDYEKELDSVLRSLRYDLPRPEYCCRLGYYFLSRGEYQPAIYWYNHAIQNDLGEDNWGFTNHSYSTWLPNLQLCVCYDRLSNYEMAYHHNEIACQFRPEDPSILHNKAYLESKLFATTKVNGEKDE